MRADCVAHGRRDFPHGAHHERVVVSIKDISHRFFGMTSVKQYYGLRIESRVGIFIDDIGGTSRGLFS